MMNTTLKRKRIGKFPFSNPIQIKINSTNY